MNYFIATTTAITFYRFTVSVQRPKRVLLDAERGRSNKQWARPRGNFGLQKRTFLVHVWLSESARPQGS